MSTIPSADAIEAAEAFDDILRSRMPELRPEAFEKSYDDFWAALENDGWLAIARELPRERPEQSLVLDLTAFAEVWGRHLLPLPFVEKIAEDLADLDGIDGVPYPVAASGAMIVTRGADSDDDFAPSLVLADPADSGGRSTYAHMHALWAAEAVGCAAAALELAVDYAKVREAYGRPIGSFQALQHLLANDLAHVEAGRSGVAACALGATGTREIALDVVDRAITVVTDAIQAHGGIGFTWELGLHLYLRHVLALRTVVAHTSPDDGAP